MATLSPHIEVIQEVPPRGRNPPNLPRVPVPDGAPPEGDWSTEFENAKRLVNTLPTSGEQTSDDMPKVLPYRPTAPTAEKIDWQMMEKWKANMSNLLVFAALFTAIVTAFALDAMSNLDEDTSTKLLRLLLEQSAINTTVGIPPPNPPSSILTVSSLWFLSIMSSVAAATWAVFCLEWCAFLADGVQTEDYGKMAEKRQRRFEAMKRWRMHLFIAAIPFSLHLSLFLFLGGLWLRLRDINEHLGLIVGVPSLIIAFNYVVVTLLPLFTDAPIPTSSTSELIRSFVNGIKGLPLIPTFRLDRNPLTNLNKLQTGRPDGGGGVRLPVLGGLRHTPLSKDEVKEALEVFTNRSTARGPLDSATIRTLVSWLTPVLENSDISEDDQPIFDHCTTVLADEMDRAFGKGEHNQGILFRNTTIFEKLSPHFRFTPLRPTISREDYWSRAIPALWLCPSREAIRGVVSQLDSNIQSMEAPHLQRIVRGLHAATLACSDPDQSTLDLIPDFSVWSWDSSSSDRGLDKALSSFLQGLFAAFFNTLSRSAQPITTPSLVVDCLNVFDDRPERYTLKLHSALCFFVAVMWRSDPGVFEDGPSVTGALLASTESYREYSGWDESVSVNLLATRLRAIAYGPKFLITSQIRSLMRLGDLYTRLPDSIKTDPRCLGGFLDAYAATLEATLAVDGRLTTFAWLHSPDCGAARNICTNPLFTHDVSFDFVRQNPNYRLPYLYSLAIALAYTIEGRNRRLWKVADLFVTRDEQAGMTIDRALDTNNLVTTILRFALCNPFETLEQEQKEKALESMRNIVMDGSDWRTRWKAIYLITDLVFLLSQMDIRYEGDGQMELLIGAAGEIFERVKFERVPSDWKRKRIELSLCGLETKVRHRARPGVRRGMGEGVYDWSGQGNVPYLSLYNPQRTPSGAFSHAASWITTGFQQPEFVIDELTGAVEDPSSTHKIQETPHISFSRTLGLGPNNYRV